MKNSEPSLWLVPDIRKLYDLSVKKNNSASLDLRIPLRAQALDEVFADSFGVGTIHVLRADHLYLSATLTLALVSLESLIATCSAGRPAFCHYFPLLCGRRETFLPRDLVAETL